MDEDIKALADAIYVEKVRRARAAPLTKKMGWGGDLSMEVCDRMRAGIRSQLPLTDAAGVEKVLRQRLRRLKLVQDHGICWQKERDS